MPTTWAKTGCRPRPRPDRCSRGDAIEEAILGGRTGHDGKNALFLARSTWNVLCELRYQVHDPQIADEALRLLLRKREWQRP